MTISHASFRANITQYGIIKKIEHFWKGLSNERTQISALPPHEYGERFINFMAGITMSAEEAERDALDREAAAAAMEAGDPNAQDAPPAPTYLPPAPPGMRSPLSPESNPIVEKAMKKAIKTEKDVAKEDQVPERVMTTTVGRSSSNAVLPVVEETAEAGSVRGQSSGGPRPYTPSERDDGYTDLGPHGIGGRGPPTPPKTSYIDMGIKRNSSERPATRDSLDKALPPLPQ